jgi:hypothetical protein
LSEQKFHRCGASALCAQRICNRYLEVAREDAALLSKMDN